MSDVSRWEPTLYQGSASFYRRGRLPYAPALADALVSALDLDGRGRLIDVGCGPGTIALMMRAVFQEVVGIDADSHMVKEALEEARRIGATNARWLRLRAEELPAGLGSFRVATFAQSFHWMERMKVARTIARMLDSPIGALVHVYAYTVKGVEPTGPMPHPRPPRDEIAASIARYLRSDAQALRLSAQVHPDDEDALLKEIGYVGPDVVTVPDKRVLTRTADDIVASVYSVSASAPHMFKNRLSDFESELRGLLHAVSPSGLFSEQTADNQLRIWRLS